MTQVTATVTPQVASRLGERVRSLRLAAGLTQTELAGDRFSKEYVSQIERGKTRPTEETIGWLATRLNVDAEFLRRGVATDVRDRVEAKLARAEALSEAHAYDEAIVEFGAARAAVGPTYSAELEVRALARRGLGPHAERRPTRGARGASGRARADRAGAVL